MTLATNTLGGTVTGGARVIAKHCWLAGPGTGGTVPATCTLASRQSQPRGGAIFSWGTYLAEAGILSSSDVVISAIWTWILIGKLCGHWAVIPYKEKNSFSYFFFIAHLIRNIKFILNLLVWINVLTSCDGVRLCYNQNNTGLWGHKFTCC